jgi:outer membrane protein TolC
LQALAAYWNWSKAVYSTDALRSAVTRTEAHAGDMRSLHNAGMATDNETLATEVLLDQTRLRLEEGRRRVDLARARIAFLTGSELVEGAAPQPPAIPADLAVPAEGHALQTAFTNRTDLTAGRLETQAAEALVRAARAEIYPQVFLTGRYEQARPNVLDFPPSDEWKDDAYVGVSLAWNVWDWRVARAKTAEAAARAAQAKLRLGQTEEQITLEVREGRINLQDGLDRVTTAKRVEQSAQRNLEAATAQWKSGLARHSEVLDAQAQLTDAEYQRIVAEADVLLCRAALLYAEGLLNKETN